MIIMRIIEMMIKDLIIIIKVFLIMILEIIEKEIM
jgi:hypothetical protein